MHIDTKKIEEYLNKLNSQIKKYDDIYLNYYNDISRIKDNWISNQARKFLENTEIEKKEQKKIINNLNDIKEIYEYILLKYKDIGNKIECDLSKKEKLVEKINLYIENLNKIINKYNNLNYKLYDTQTISILQEEANQLKLCLKNIIDIKKSIIDKLNIIEEIDKELKLKISKINISIINETNPKDYF